MKAFNKKKKPKHTIKTVYKRGWFKKDFWIFSNSKKVSLVNPSKKSLTIIKYNDYVIKLKID